MQQLTPIPAPYRRLVHMVAYAFYTGECPPYEEPPPGVKAPMRKGTNAAFPGLGAITLDALTRREWVKEDELAEQLKVHPKVMRRVLRYLEQEQLGAHVHTREKELKCERAKRGGAPAGAAAAPSASSGAVVEEEQLVAREHRKEKEPKGERAKRAGAPATAAAAPAASDGVAGEELDENEDIQKAFVHSYCALDYARMVDMVSLRLHRMRRRLKDAVQKRNPVQEYACPTCGARYNSLQALSLIDPSDAEFHCELCRTVLVDAEDPGGGGGGDGGGDDARRVRMAEAKALQAKVETDLKPLAELLADIHTRMADGAKVPDYGTLTDWALAQAQARARAAANGRGRGAAPGDEMYEARVDIDLVDSGAAAAPGAGAGAAKRELPPWLRGQAWAAAEGGASGVEGPPGGVVAPPEPAPAEAGSAASAEDVEAAYVRAFQEKVRRREAELAAQGAGTAAPDDKAGPEKKKLRVDGDYSGAAAGGAGAGLGAKPVAGPAAVKAEPAAAVRSSGCPEDAPGVEAAAKAEKSAPAEDEDIEWEEAGAPTDAASGGGEDDVEWEEA